MRSGDRWARAVELVAWLVVVAVGVLAVTVGAEWAGWFGALAVAQTLVPYGGILVALIAGVALWRRRPRLAAVACASGTAVLLLAAPLAFPGPRATAAPGSTGLVVASANLLYLNERPDDVPAALANLDADVLVLLELTPEQEAALQASALDDRYPYRAGRSAPDASGAAVWSSLPITELPTLDTSNPGVDVVVDGPDGPVRVVGVHPTTPIDDFARWRTDLALVRRLGETAEQPMLVIGDFNASFWHPDFRRLLDAGYRDAHIEAGVGFTTSWPMTWIVPPFVRLDHALTANGLTSTDVGDFEIPGSDHRGVIVTVAPAR